MVARNNMGQSNDGSVRPRENSRRPPLQPTLHTRSLTIAFVGTIFKPWEGLRGPSPALCPGSTSCINSNSPSLSAKAKDRLTLLRNSFSRCVFAPASRRRQGYTGPPRRSPCRKSNTSSCRYLVRCDFESRDPTTYLAVAGEYSGPQETSPRFLDAALWTKPSRSDGDDNDAASCVSPTALAPP